MAHHSRLAGFIIDCEGGSLGAAAGFWSQALGLPVLDPDEDGLDKYARLDGSPVGACSTIQRPWCGRATSLAPSATRRAASASMSSLSMSRCTR